MKVKLDPTYFVLYEPNTGSKNTLLLLIQFLDSV